MEKSVPLRGLYLTPQQKTKNAAIYRPPSPHPSDEIASFMRQLPMDALRVQQTIRKFSDAMYRL
jgi:hypothetical protein